ncbi:WD40/YVTN/BNR-like repeat-containing protein [Ulvibacterium sp.]|uniref:WD40/YVTN/BNR-like repeat-containing protein n=1 Tax=Ulvibacterium sp. TaxID=2665914 RepID=UPI003BAB7929
MRFIPLILTFPLLFSCSEEKGRDPFSSVKVEVIYQDSLSIRAIEIMGNSLAFAANKGTFGTIDLSRGTIRTNIQHFDSIVPEFRAIAHTTTDFFMLSAGNPALLYKTGNKGRMELVYKEEGDGVFYDAMTFWNDLEGIAIGDSVGGCLSIIITRDGGNTWNKLPCDFLPAGIEGEGAFAASNSNIVTMANKTWIATTKGRIYFSPNKGQTWKVFETPIQSRGPTQGIYSIDFYDESVGVVFGGDYTRPENNKANKAITKDGGETWLLVADGQNPSYKSCVRFVPNSKGKEIVALGFTGISYSSDRGETWKAISEEPFYTVRFLNDSTAYAAGKGRVAKLSFKTK